MKNTKKALITSALCLLLCMSMLVGTTFAWFTDTTSTGVNTIVSGKLDVVLEYWDGDSWEDAHGESLKFIDLDETTLWEPGCTYELPQLRVTNAGNLHLKYQIVISGLTGDAKLLEVIDWTVNGDPMKVEYAGSLAPNTSSEALTLKGHMQESAGNEYMDLKIENISISVYATQVTAESDSFNNYYDGATPWYGDVDTSWYNADAEELVIKSAEELAGLAELVNTGVDNFAGKTVKLVSNIDLANRPWTTIVGFAGNFDGQEYTINNLYVNSADWGQGLFGYLDGDVTIKNLTVNNAHVVSGDEIAGVVVGYTMKGNFSNIHVTGDVTVKAMSNVGGIVGYGKATSFDNCSVTGATITATTGSFAGGIIGDHGEGTAYNITNCAVENATITAYAGVGGIAGKIGYGNTVDSCSVKNVTLNKTRIDGNPSIGILSGVWGYNDQKAITLTNNTAVDVTLNGTSIAYEAYNVLYGSEFYGRTTTNFVLDNNTIEYSNNVEEILAATPATVQAVIDAASAGDVITLLSGKYHDTIVMKSGITLQGSEGAVVDCINLNGSENVTLKGIAFDAAGAKMAYGGDNKQRFPANIIGRDSSNLTVAGARGVVIEGCTFSGNFAEGGMAICFSDQTRAQSGNVTITGCKFETTGGYVDIYTYYAGYGAFVIENNTFASDCIDRPIYLGRYQSSTPVVVKGNEFVKEASFAAATFLQDHGSYGVSFGDTTGNTFGG